MRGRRVVVTGASGFLGSHVADRLANSGYEVVGFDARANPRHEAVAGDLLDLEALREAFSGAAFVCHLGAIGDVYLAADQPALAASVNVVGTANVCEAALATGVGRVVVASTWEVYGAPRYQPIDEEHPCDPDHPYSITKRAGERIALAYAALRNLNVVALRLGTAYGTRMRPNSVFSIFIRKALRGEPITIQGSGEQSRQFTHAADIARAFETALTRGRGGATYNIVAERSVSIRELAEAVTALVPTQLAYAPPRPGDVTPARVSSARAAEELGWRPQVAFAEGLRELVDEARMASVQSA